MEDWSLHPLGNRYEQYCKEVRSIERKLQHDNLPQGKKERIAFRLRDLNARLIPQLMAEMQS